MGEPLPAPQALHLALAADSDADVIRLLLEEGADVHAVNADANTVGSGGWTVLTRVMGQARLGRCPDGCADHARAELNVCILRFRLCTWQQGAHLLLLSGSSYRLAPMCRLGMQRATL